MKSHRFDQAKGMNAIPHQALTPQRHGRANHGFTEHRELTIPPEDWGGRDSSQMLRFASTLRVATPSALIQI